MTSSSTHGIRTVLQPVSDLAGARAVHSARDVGSGRLVSTFSDADGNVLGLLQDPPASAG
jgi:hypothetical protein